MKFTFSLSFKKKIIEQPSVQKIAMFFPRRPCDAFNQSSTVYTNPLTKTTNKAIAISKLGDPPKLLLTGAQATFSHFLTHV